MSLSFAAIESGGTAGVPSAQSTEKKGEGRRQGNSLEGRARACLTPRAMSRPPALRGGGVETPPGGGSLTRIPAVRRRAWLRASVPVTPLPTTPGPGGQSIGARPVSPLRWAVWQLGPADEF